MTVANPPLPEQPRLVFFYSSLSGHCRRVEGFLAQVLQRRRNHATFDVVLVAEEERPDLLERFKIDPAIASSVFVTTFTDTCGFALLLGLGTMLLR